MCLDTIDQITQNYIEGYKVFSKDLQDGTLRSPIFRDAHQFMEGHTIYDLVDSVLIRASNGAQYYTGFHCFATLEGARDWKATGIIYQDQELLVIHRVCPSGITASGYQIGFPAFVTRELLVKEQVI